MIYLRVHLRLPLDDLLAVIREFIEPSMSRSALDRLLHRRGQSRLPAPDAAVRRSQPFKAYEPGYLHVDVKYLPQMADEAARRYVFVAIDRATRWVFIAINPRKTAAAARAFLTAVAKAAPFTIQRLLTDNGKEFTSRAFGPHARQASDTRPVQRRMRCTGYRSSADPAQVTTDQRHGRALQWALAQVLRSHHFNCADDLETTLHRYVWLYNQHLPQKALNHETPIQALKRWQTSHPNRFIKNVRNHPGPDI